MIFCSSNLNIWVLASWRKSAKSLMNYCINMRHVFNRFKSDHTHLINYKFMIQFVISWMLILSLQEQENLLQFVIDYNEVYQLQKFHHLLNSASSAVMKQSLKLNMSDFLVRELIFAFFIEENSFLISFLKLICKTLNTYTHYKVCSTQTVINRYHYWLTLLTMCLQINSCWTLYVTFESHICELTHQALCDADLSTVKELRWIFNVITF